jgi:hypothetical protein
MLWSEVGVCVMTVGLGVRGFLLRKELAVLELFLVVVVVVLGMRKAWLY